MGAILNGILYSILPAIIIAMLILYLKKRSVRNKGIERIKKQKLKHRLKGKEIDFLGQIEI